MSTEAWILIAVLAIVLIAALPNWGYSRSWGYGPSTLVGVVAAVLVVWVLMHNDSARNVTDDAGDDIRAMGEDLRSGARKAVDDVRDAVNDASR